MATKTRGEDFLGDWKVFAGDMRDSNPASSDSIGRGCAVIERLEDGRFQLCSRIGDDCMTLQTMRYTEQGTLVSCGEERREKPWLPLRCVAYWRPEDQEGLENPRRFIFAMRRKVNHLGEAPAPSTYLASWESSNDTGTWGAEEEAGEGSQSPSSRNDAQK